MTSDELRKYCSRCCTYRLASEVVIRVVRSKGHDVHTAICIYCQRDLEAARHKTVEERDAFGRAITRRNREQNGKISRLVNESKREREQRNG